MIHFEYFLFFYKSILFWREAPKPVIGNTWRSHDKT